MDKLIARLKEPSTWAGVGLVAQGLFQLIESKGGDAAAYSTIAAGFAAMFLPEKGEQEISRS